jgi:WD40 repeat protein
MKRGCRFLEPWEVLTLVAVVGSLLMAQAWAADQPRKIEPVASMGHSDYIYAVAFSPNGAQVLSGSRDKTLKLWDTASGHMIRTFVGHSEPIVSVAFSPDGARVLSGGDDKTMKLWDVQTGQLLHSFMHSGWVVSVAFSPDGKRVLSGSDDKTLKLWDVASGQLARTYTGHSSTVTSVAFSRDGSRILSGSKDGSIKLWDTASGHLIRTVKVLSDSDAGVESVAISRDGSRLLAGSFDNKARLWDAASGEMIRSFEGKWGEDRSVAFSADGTHVLTLREGSVSLWDAATGNELRSFSGGGWSVSFSPDGSRILSGLRLWDAADGHVIRDFEGYGDEVTKVAFSRNGSRILAGSKGTLRMWDAASGQSFPHSEIDEPLAFSADGTLVMSKFELRNASSGQLIRSFGLAPVSASAAFSPDRSRILTGGRYDEFNLWDAGSGRLIQSFKGHAGYIYSVAFSPDGARIVSGSDDVTVKLWDAASGQLLHSFDEHSDTINSVAFSPDGTRILSGSDDNTLRMWDASSYQLLHIFKGHAGPVRSVAFSPDGTGVLSGSKDNTVKLWDAATGKELQSFAGHTNAVNSVAFSPDGRYALSGSDDGTTRVWDTRNGQQLAALVAASDSDWLALTPNGFFAASQSDTDLLAIVRGVEVTTIGQVHQSLFSPDLVREALAGDPDGEVKRAAEVVDLDKVLDSGPAPLAEIRSSPSGDKSVSDNVAVSALIKDRGKGIGRIEWRVNGVTTAVMNAPSAVGPEYEVKQTLALDSGENAIEVVAYNARNLLASLPAQSTITYSAPAGAEKPKLYVLAIGINAYHDEGWTPPGATKPEYFPPLKLAVDDAKSVSEAFKEAGTGFYGQVIVRTAFDEAATAAGLERIVQDISAEINPRDTFVLFAAAHGYSNNGRFYLLPQDYHGGTDLAALTRRAIGQERLQGWIAGIKARRGMILLDTCESGALTNSYAHSRTDAPASEAAVGRLHEATGRPVLTAAAAGKPAFEGYRGHGVFTWALIDALFHGDTNGDGLIELSELAAHVQNTVPKISAEMNSRGIAEVLTQILIKEDRQTAHFGSTGGDFPVVRRLQ